MFEFLDGCSGLNISLMIKLHINLPLRLKMSPGKVVKLVVSVQEGDVDSRAGQVRRHASFSSRDSEKTEQQAAVKRHASSESCYNYMSENMAAALFLTWKHIWLVSYLSDWH